MQYPMCEIIDGKSANKSDNYRKVIMQPYRKENQNKRTGNQYKPGGSTKPYFSWMLMMMHVTESIFFGIGTIYRFTVANKPVKHIFDECPRYPAQEKKVAIYNLRGKVLFQICGN